MRTLVLCHEGAPMMHSVTVGPIRARIQEWPDDDADLWQVWSVPDEQSHAVAADATERFAMMWAEEIIAERGFGDGIEPSDYLAPFPAFIRETVGDKLQAKWAATHEQTRAVA